MANSKECEICKKMTKKKHRLDMFYRIGFWVVLVIAIVFIGLYFSSGEVFKHTEIINENSNNKEISIDNGGDNNSFIVGELNDDYTFSQGSD